MVIVQYVDAFNGTPSRPQTIEVPYRRKPRTFTVGIAGIGAAVLGKVADHVGIIDVFHGCAWLPLIGMLTIFLPDIEGSRKK